MESLLGVGGHAGRSPLKRFLIQVLAYGVPAYFLSTYLQKLGGTALWIPSPWRKTITVLVLGAGMACFQLARLHRARIARSGRSSPERPARLATRVALVSAAAAVDVAVEAPAAETPEPAAEADPVGERRIQLLALASCAAMLAFLVPQLFLRFHCVIPWNPDEVVVHAEYGDPPDLSAVPPPAQLEAAGAGFKGSVLVPLRSRLSAALLKRIADRAERYDQPGIQAFLDKEPIHFIELLGAESRALWETVVLILLVHLGILLSGSIAYGYSFNLIEDLAQALPGFG